LGLGTSLLTSTLLRITSNLTGSTSTFGTRIDGVVQSDSTSSAYYFQSVAATQATAFTLADLTHFFAQRGTIGAGSSITNQYAFRADSNIIGATNNYGFYGDIVSGTGRWNFYANGTALNYFNGNVQIGSTTATAGAEKLQVTGTASISSTLLVGGALTGSSTAQFTKLGLGAAVSATQILRISTQITGATNFNVVSINSQIQSDVTSSVNIFDTFPSTAASAFTLTNLTHYSAATSTIGATSSVTNQNGFLVTSLMVGATNNYGFRGQIPSGANRWNIYMDGTASNYFNGNVQIGSTTPTAGAEKLQVTGTASVSGALSIGNTVATAVSVASTHKVTIVIGGVTYYLLATNV
jgi:hypothetical protein